MRENVRAGFSLIEIIVVIAMLAILFSIATFSAGNAREMARDFKRQSDVDQIALAMRLYAQQYDGYPDCELGTVLEPGRAPLTVGAFGYNCPDEQRIRDYLTNYFGEIPVDPLGPDNPDYYYYFDSEHICFSGIDTAMVFAVNMEATETNIPDICNVRDGPHGGYLETPSISPSVPYVSLLSITAP